MSLDINKMDYNILYKTLDENEMYFTIGITYVAKFKNKKIFSKEPVIYVCHFSLDGRVDSVEFGKLIDYKYQNGLEYNIMGWYIDKDTNPMEIEKTKPKERLHTLATLFPVSPDENILLHTEISNFLSNPKEYHNKGRIIKCR